LAILLPLFHFITPLNITLVLNIKIFFVLLLEKVIMSSTSNSSSSDDSNDCIIIDDEEEQQTTQVLLEIKPGMKVFALKDKLKHIWLPAILIEIKSNIII